MAVAFTDEKIRIVDLRVKPTKDQLTERGNATLILEGQHSDLIKKIKMSPDGTNLLSTG